LHPKHREGYSEFFEKQCEYLEEQYEEDYEKE
jgi:hypothetical protein